MGIQCSTYPIKLGNMELHETGLRIRLPGSGIKSAQISKVWSSPITFFPNLLSLFFSHSFFRCIFLHYIHSLSPQLSDTASNRRRHVRLIINQKFIPLERIGTLRHNERTVGHLAALVSFVGTYLRLNSV